MPNPRRPAHFFGGSDNGLVVHMGQKHGGQSLTQESVAQLRQLDGSACVICGTIRSRRGSRCTHCRAGTATRDTLAGDIFQDGQQAGHRDAAATKSNPPPPSHQPAANSARKSPRLQSTPKQPHFGTSPLQRDAQLVIDLRQASQQWPFLAALFSRYATAWAESFEGALTGHQSWAMLCRCRSQLLLLKVPSGHDRNTELKQRLRLWEAGSFTISLEEFWDSSTLGNRTGQRQPPARTEEQRGKSASAPTTKGSISKAMEGLVGGAASGSAACRKHWTTARIPRSSGQGYTSLERGAGSSYSSSVERRQVQNSPQRFEGTRTQ